MNGNEMVEEIIRLKKEKNAVILAHNYQIPEVQDIADYVGDSLKLSQIASETDKDLIVFCGVQFMAESAKILSPEKKVLLPVIDAGCPMADMITGEDLRKYKEENPNVQIVTYVNSSAEVKAYSDICCTSSNALNVVKSLDSNEILFAPDKNLGSYIAGQVKDKNITLWNGFCITHESVKTDEVDLARSKRPNVKILIHPECNPKIVEKADFIGSTSQIIEYVKNSDDKEFYIGTEMGILHSIRKVAPDKELHLLSKSLVCYNMKKTSLQDVYNALKNDMNEIVIDEDIRLKAYNSLKRMLSIDA